MNKLFKAALPHPAPTVLAALIHLGEAEGRYRLAAFAGNKVKFEIGGFTAKEWATSTQATVDPKRTLEVNVEPDREDRTVVAVRVTRIGLFDPFGFLKKDFLQLMQDLTLRLEVEDRKD